MAALVAGQPEPEGPPPSPSWREYDPHRAVLDNILDRLGEVIAAVYGSAGGKPPRIAPARRPVTEIDRARLRLDKKAHDLLVDEVKAAQERWTQNRGGGADARS